MFDYTDVHIFPNIFLEYCLAYKIWYQLFPIREYKKKYSNSTLKSQRGKTNKQEKDYHHCPSLWTISSLSKCMDQMGSRPPPLANNIRFMFRLNRSSRVLHVTTMYRILARFTRPYTCIIFLFFFHLV